MLAHKLGIIIEESLFCDGLIIIFMGKALPFKECTVLSYNSYNCMSKTQKRRKEKFKIQ